MRHQHKWIDESEEALFRPPTAAMVLIRLAEEADRRREREASRNGAQPTAAPAQPDEPKRR